MPLIVRAMPWANNSKIDELRLKYNAAVAAHRACDATLAKLRNAGEIPSQGLKDAELRARDNLSHARDALLAAMTEAITGHAAAELDPPGGDDT